MCLRGGPYFFFIIIYVGRIYKYKYEKLYLCKIYYDKYSNTNPCIKMKFI